MTYSRKFNILLILVIVAIIAVSTVLVCTPGTQSRALAIPRPTPAIDKPPYSSYKGVAIGATIDEARAKLGAPKEKSDGQDAYEFSASESAQVNYDASQKVTVISVTYTGKLDNAPTPKAVFGVDVEAKPDGGIFKLEHYPKAGYWISYIKTGGDEPLIMIVMQKI